MVELPTHRLKLKKTTLFPTINYFVAGVTQILVRYTKVPPKPLTCPKPVTIKFYKLAIDLENGVNVPKHSQLFRLSERYSCAALVGIKPKVQKIYQF